PGRHDLAHQADALGLLGVDGPGGQHQLEGPGGPDQPGQRVADADVAAADADLDELGAEAGLGGGEPDVAGQGEGEPAAVGRAVDGGDDGLREPAELLRQLGDAGLGQQPGAGPGRAGGRGGAGRAVGQVEAGAEAPAGAGQHDDPAGRVVLQLVERVVQLVDEPEAEGVELLGPVQRQDRDVGSGALDEQIARPGVLPGHGAAS